MNSSLAFGSFPHQFLLVGLSWVEDKKLPVSLLFLFMYLVVILSNCTIIVLIKMDQKLQEPMHIFIALLSLTDLSISSATIPKVLTIIWFSSNTISSAECLTQAYILYTMWGLQSSIFALMSFDRYVAICHPLRHSTLISRSFMTKSVALIVARSILTTFPLTFLIVRLSYSDLNTIYDIYCEFREVMKLSYGDLMPLSIYMVILICVYQGGDNSIIVFSYLQMLSIVYKLKSPQARWKSLSTCSSQAILLSLFYISTSIPFYLIFYPDTPLYVKTIAEVLSFLLLPMLNPIIYGARSKDIQDGLRRLYQKLVRL
ncbi:olfactory receptor 52D1-like [Engystomops pustulosus]|uniref:olfactory receptor 52D1-like n=1 Tax=Engystomops pustulosus TaxID=76066 RepID=UPI003AFAFFD7